VLVGAVPVVWGGAQYSAIFPRKADDVDGSHPVFIDAASFASPEHLADYLIWLADTGNVDRYRPWLREDVLLPDAPREAWPCNQPDIVRCGFGHIASSPVLESLDRHLFEVWRGQPVPDAEVEPWLSSAQAASAWAMTKAGTAAVQFVTSNASTNRVVAPWRQPNADPTLEKWKRIIAGRGHSMPEALGPDDVTMDLRFCKCSGKIATTGWCGMPGDHVRRMRAGASHLVYTGLSQSIERGQHPGFRCVPWTAPPEGCCSGRLARWFGSGARWCGLGCPALGSP
jgi:hypothetical protein